jgi:hypothetical protein
MSDTRNLRNVRPLGNEEPAGQKREGDGAARAGELPAWDCLDFLASAFGMWTAFTSRSLSNAGQINLAEIGKGVKP